MKKAPLLVLGTIILVSMGVGIILGIGISDSNEPSKAGQTPSDTQQPPTVTPIAGEPVDPQSDPLTPSPSSTDHNQVRNLLLAAINDFRDQHNLQPVTNTGYPTTRLDRMATNHSQQMAAEETARLSLKGSMSSERYAEYGLTDICSFPSNSGYSTVDPASSQLELVANPVPPSPYKNADGGYEGDAQEAVETTLQRWRNSKGDKQKLLYKNAEQVGIGVAISDDDGLYITASLCG